MEGGRRTGIRGDVTKAEVGVMRATSRSWETEGHRFSPSIPRRDVWPAGSFQASDLQNC